MSIFRRKPRFKVGDRVMVTSLYMGRPKALHEPIVRRFRSERIGSVGRVAYVFKSGMHVIVGDGFGLMTAREWELRPA